MKRVNTTCVLMAGLLLAGCSMTEPAATEAEPQPGNVRYETFADPQGQLVVIETVEVKAPVRAVWEAFTTGEGYASWAAPAARVDLRPGGSIVSSYDPELGLKSPNVITLRIVNYVPERLLTLQADVSQNWPDVLKRDADNLYNVIRFEPLGSDRTRVISYGLGYTDSPELRTLMAYFRDANQMLYKKLIRTLEDE